MESQQHTSCFNVLLGMSKELAQKTSIQKTLEGICAHIEQYFTPKHLAILLLEPETGNLTFHLVWGNKKDMLSNKQLKKGKGIAGWVAERDESLFIADTKADPRFQTNFLSTKTQDSTSIMAVPLKSNNIIYGVMEVFDNNKGTLFTKNDLEDLQTIAEITTLCIERVYYLQAMKRMSETDQLTDLPNKRSFDQYMQREIEICKRYDIPSSVMLLTLQKLRQLNEDHGFAITDKIIQFVSEIMSNDVRKVDTVCKISADTFAVIMPNTEKVSAQDIANRISNKISQQAIISQLPKFSTNIQIHTGTVDNVHPLLSLAQPNKDEVLGFRKFRNVAKNLRLLLKEEKQATEQRQYYRKGVRLPGHFEHREKHTSGDALIESLSLSGVGFTTLDKHDLTKNDILSIRFQLDDSRKTVINRLVRVQYIRGRYIGCQFTDQKSYDSDLGFYLMQ